MPTPKKSVKACRHQTWSLKDQADLPPEIPRHYEWCWICGALRRVIGDQVTDWRYPTKDPKKRAMPLLGAKLHQRYGG